MQDPDPFERGTVLAVDDLDQMVRLHCPKILGCPLDRHPEGLRDRPLDGMVSHGDLQEDEEACHLAEIPEEFHAFARKRLIESSQLEIYQVYLIERYGGLDARILLLGDRCLPALRGQHIGSGHAWTAGGRGRHSL